MKSFFIYIGRVIRIWSFDGYMRTVHYSQDIRNSCYSAKLLFRLLPGGLIPSEANKLWCFLNQSLSDVRNTTAHGGLADADGISHLALEGPGCVESQGCEYLNIWADGS